MLVHCFEFITKQRRRYMWFIDQDEPHQKNQEKKLDVRPEVHKNSGGYLEIQVSTEVSERCNDQLAQPLCEPHSVVTEEFSVTAKISDWLLCDSRPSREKESVDTRNGLESQISDREFFSHHRMRLA